MSDCCSGPHPHRQPIKAAMTVAEFNESYPELEQTLVEISSDLTAAARSGLLGSLAGLTTLAQLAEAQDQTAAEIVQELKTAASGALKVDFSYNGEFRPDWFDEAKVSKTLDAREILAAGGHPMGAVTAALPELNECDIFELMTPFLPGPLINRLAEKGYQSWSRCDEANLFHNYFLKQGQAAMSDTQLDKFVSKLDLTTIEGNIDYQSGSIVSQTLFKEDAGTVTLFAFDKGQGLSEHTAPFAATVHILDGAAVITIDGEPETVPAGKNVLMPANHPHALQAIERFKMLLVMVKA